MTEVLARVAAAQAANLEESADPSVALVAGPGASTPPWPTLSPAACPGLVGDVIDTLGPHTEADPAAIVGQLLVAFGNAVGRTPYSPVEADRHYANLNLLLVGRTSSGRKGTSLGRARGLLEPADPDWVRACQASGLSSGEGVIWQVRDAIEKQEPVKDKGKVIGYQQIVTDPGISDKRLLVVESEFASTLRVMGREGNTLSAVIRAAWDSGNLRVLSKNSPAQSSGAHISIIAHCTSDELRRELQATDAVNGFLNRFLVVCARRSKCLPEGGAPSAALLAELSRLIGIALMDARKVGVVHRDDAARGLWAEVYPGLSEGVPGLLGAAIGRAAAQVVRLSLIYALLDRKAIVERGHLEAALAFWDYCEASARYVFGEKLGDPVSDRILDELRAGGADGLSRTEIRDLFDRHKSSEIDRALANLEELGLAVRGEEPTGGRPREVWRVRPKRQKVSEGQVMSLSSLPSPVEAV